MMKTIKMMIALNGVMFFSIILAVWVMGFLDVIKLSSEVLSFCWLFMFFLYVVVIKPISKSFVKEMNEQNKQHEEWEERQEIERQEAHQKAVALFRNEQRIANEKISKLTNRKLFKNYDFDIPKHRQIMQVVYDYAVLKQQKFHKELSLDELNYIGSNIVYDINRTIEQEKNEQEIKKVMFEINNPNARYSTILDKF